MSPKAATNGDRKTGKTFSTDVVAAVLMATGTTSLTLKNYELMSSLDGVKTATAIQHDFRAVLAKSKELKARVENGEIFEPVLPATKRGKSCGFSFYRTSPSPLPNCCSLLSPAALPGAATESQFQAALPLPRHHTPLCSSTPSSSLSFSFCPTPPYLAFYNQHG
jgi:hypothetical protein